MLMRQVVKGATSSWVAHEVSRNPGKNLLNVSDIVQTLTVLGQIPQEKHSMMEVHWEVISALTPHRDEEGGLGRGSRGVLMQL